MSKNYGLKIVAAVVAVAATVSVQAADKKGAVVESSAVSGVVQSQAVDANGIVGTGATRPNGIVGTGATRPNGIVGTGATRPNGIVGTGATRPN